MGSVKGYDPAKCVFFEGGYLEKITSLFGRFGCKCGDEVDTEGK
jgi:hypothetical protein